MDTNSLEWNERPRIVSFHSNRSNPVEISQDTPSYARTDPAPTHDKNNAIKYYYVLPFLILSAIPTSLIIESSNAAVVRYIPQYLRGLFYSDILLSLLGGSS